MISFTRRQVFAAPALSLLAAPALASAMPPPSMPPHPKQTGFEIVPPGPTPKVGVSPSPGQDQLTIIFDDAILRIPGDEGGSDMRTIQGILSFKIPAQRRAKSLNARLSGANHLQGAATAAVHLTIGGETCTYNFQEDDVHRQDFLRDMCVNLYRPATYGTLPFQLAMSGFNPSEGVDSRFDIDSIDIEFDVI